MDLKRFISNQLPKEQVAPSAREKHMFECRAIEGFQRINEGIRRRHSMPIREGKAILEKAVQKCSSTDRDFARLLHYGLLFANWILDDTTQINNHFTALEQLGLKKDKGAIFGHGVVLHVIASVKPAMPLNHEPMTLVREMPEPKLW